VPVSNNVSLDAMTIEKKKIGKKKKKKEEKRNVTRSNAHR